MTIRVCDSLMGSGKSQAAIRYVNEEIDKRFLYITPYLDEVDRIVNSCTGREMTSPENLGSGKLQSLHSLLEEKKNVCCTHALFTMYDDTTVELLKQGNYHLIIDEILQSVNELSLCGDDINILKNSGLIKVDPVTNEVIWLNRKNKSFAFEEFRDCVQHGTVFVQDDSAVFWSMPVKIFEAFNTVTILTYMFNSQVQKYYFDVAGIDVEYIYVKNEGGGVYRFTDEVNEYMLPEELKEKIHIYNGKKVNSVGDDRTALSMSWFRRNSNSSKMDLLRRNLNNVFTNIYKANAGNKLWTTFKSFADTVGGKKHRGAFVSCNLRATNEYRARDKLAYCLNVFFNPFLKRYFLGKGVEVNEDGYALSEMLQWIWRSAIRDGKEIWIYIPSKRMRELLINWLDGKMPKPTGNGRRLKNDGKR